MITFHTTIHDGIVSLLCDALLSNIRVDPVWEAPLLWRYLAPLDRSTNVLQDHLPECLVEVAVIEEDVWVMEPPIEMSLDGFDRLEDAV